MENRIFLSQIIPMYSTFSLLQTLSITTSLFLLKFGFDVSISWLASSPTELSSHLLPKGV